jgi:hypothetical protein
MEGACDTGRETNVAELNLESDCRPRSGMSPAARDDVRNCRRDEAGRAAKKREAAVREIKDPLCAGWGRQGGKSYTFCISARLGRVAE